MRVNKLYDVVAPVYGRVVPGMYDLVTRRAAQRLAAGGPQRVLEVGVGPGHLLSAVARKSPGAVGVDISMGMLRQTRRKLGKDGREAILVRADACCLPFGDGEFDGVVAAFLLDLFPKASIPDTLREISRVLTPGGRIVVASLQFSNPILKQLWMLTYKVVPDLVGRVRPIDFQDYVDGTGLRVLQDEVIPQAAGTRLLTLVKVVG